MNTRMKVPQMAGVRQSVEVRQGSKGVGRMLRRGLHGAKNWTLELDENGEHRSVWSKGFRAAVILLPLWIVLSAVTGGPERGGQSVGAFQSVVGALVVLLVGLSVFSARERRLGREEPWGNLLVNGDDDTDGDDGEAETLIDGSLESRAAVIENSQVTELGSDEIDEIMDDNSVISTETPQIEQPDLQQTSHQATSLEPETVAIAVPEAPVEVFPQPVQQAITEGAKQEESDQTFEAIASVVEEFRQRDVHQTIQEPAYSLVKDDVESVQSELQQSTSEWASVDVSGSTESSDGAIEDEPTARLRSAVQGELHDVPPAIESPQVNLEKEPVQQPLQGVLQVEFATPGPYSVTDEPDDEDWWVVTPDVEPDATEMQPEPEAPITAEEPELATVAAQAAPKPGRHHPVVLAYFASQAPKSGFTTGEKDQARTELISWLREEISVERLSRAEASRMLGVDPSTVTRWLSDDPWGG